MDQAYILNIIYFMVILLLKYLQTYLKFKKINDYYIL